MFLQFLGHIPVSGKVVVTHWTKIYFFWLMPNGKEEKWLGIIYVIFLINYFFVCKFWAPFFGEKIDDTNLGPFPSGPPKWKKSV